MIDRGVDSSVGQGRVCPLPGVLRAQLACSGCCRSAAGRTSRSPAQRSEPGRAPPHRPARAAGIVCREARYAGEVADHHAIRHRVFVEEQAIFDGSDRDDRDDDPAVIAWSATATASPPAACGCSRSTSAAGLWQGDRLAVLRRSPT